MNFAMIFPGQGSQSLGMLQDVAAQSAIVRDTYEEASTVLGYDLWAIQSNDNDKLNQTEITQPALLVASVALWRLWQTNNAVQPSHMAGHSLGEYSALVCADSIAFQDAVSIVAKRGQFMQHAVPAGTGGMAAVMGIDEAALIAICETAAADDVVAPANFNSKGQVVISGSKAAVARAMIAAKEAGAKVIELAVSVPSHCLLMKPAAEKLQVELEQIDIKPPKLPVIQNVDAKAQSNVDVIRQNLIRQLYEPVRWVETVLAMQAAGVVQTIECGPGKVLSGLNRRIDKTIKSLQFNSVSTVESTLTEFNKEGEIQWA